MKSVPMLGDEKKLDSGDMFHVFNVDELIPPNHLLRRLDAVLDTSWVRKEVADCYSDRGRPSWDPEVIIRMILLGYLYDLSEVRLVDELRMHMGYRWFCRLQPSDPVPDRTTLVKIRNEKWKSDIWRKLLEKTIVQCQEAGLVSGRHVSIDGTKIKANASWGSLEPIVPVVSLNEYLENRFGWDDRVRETKDDDSDDDIDPTPKGGVNFRGKSLKNDEYQSKTDRDARIYRKDDGEGACLAYIGNFCIDTKFRVVLGAEASPGRTNGEWTAGINMLDFVGDVLGVMPEIVTADKGYGVVPFYSEVEKRGIISHIPTRNRTSETHLPTSRLLGMKTVPFDRAKKMIAHRRGITARNRVQRIKNTRGYRVSRLLRLRVEHKIGEAKECHGLRRARHRGLDKVDHQVKITAAVMNLKQLAKLGFRPVGATARRIASAAGRLYRLPSLVGRMLDRVLHRIFKTSPRLAFATGHSSQGF
jgi:transposase